MVDLQTLRVAAVSSRVVASEECGIHTFTFWLYSPVGGSVTSRGDSDQESAIQVRKASLG